MGRLIVILLVMLLPLRGWSVERMAVQMAYSQTAVDVSGSQASMAGMPADCPMLAPPISKTEKNPHPNKSLAGCQTCQLCMTLASLTFPPTQLTAHLVEIHLDLASDNFISADVAPQVKPPIL